MSGWNGRKVETARAYWKKRLPLPCSKQCGKIVDGNTPWHVDHVIPRALQGSEGRANQWPAHAKCNTSDGGKLGAAMKRREQDAPKNIRQWISEVAEEMFTIIFGPIGKSNEIVNHKLQTVNSKLTSRCDKSANIHSFSELMATLGSAPLPFSFQLRISLNHLQEKKL